MDFTPKAPRRNPFAKANIFSTIFFWWVIPIFREGRKKNLEVNDMFDTLPDDLSGPLGDEFEEKWNKEVKKSAAKKKSPSLVATLFSLVGKTYIIGSIGISVGEIVFRISQPVILRELIKSFSDDTTISRRDQYFYAGGISLASLGLSLCYHPSAFHLFRISMRCRLALSSLIYRKIFGIAAMTGVGCILILMPVQYMNGRLTARFRRSIAQRTDERGRIMNEIIMGIRILKMYAWEKPFSAVINQLRKLEVEALTKRLHVRGVSLILSGIALKIIMFLTVLTYVLEGNDISADKVFFTSAIYQALALIWLSLIPSGIAGVGEIMVAMSRITTFLTLEEKEPSEGFTASEIFSNPQNQPQVTLDSTSARWIPETETLSALNATLKGDKVVIIAGPCGSGKSSLLNLLLGELPLDGGKVSIQGRLSYSPQEAWVFAGSVRQNILFGRPFDQKKYDEAVTAAALLDDFKQLDYGDETIVGERGVSLSGGQKARVNLARCLYQDADIYLLDDPLSAVDTKVSRHLFDKCIKKHLAGKLRILVTHQLQYLPQADHIIVLNNGKILAQGTYDQLVDAEIDFVSLMVGDDEEANSRKTSLVTIADEAKAKAEKLNSAGNTVSQIGSTSKEQNLKTEKKATGSVGFKIYTDYFKMGRSPFLLFFTVVVFILCQLAVSSADFFLSIWTNAEYDYMQYLEQQEAINQSSTTPSSFLNDDDYLGQNTYIYIYSGIILAVVVTNIFRSLSFFSYSLKIGINLHNAMFSSIVRAPVKFFDDNPSGRVMNRFTKDLGSMDESLPPTLFDMMMIFGQMAGILVVVILSNYYIAVPAAVVLLVLWWVRRYYVSTARDVKRIEGITKSPIFTHSSSSFSGLATIRALHAESVLIQQFDALQDIHTSSWFIFFSSMRCFGLWIEIISTCFLTFVSFSFLITQDSVQMGNVGLAISSAMGITGMLQYGMRQSAEVENLMTSVERNLEYADLPSEAPLESQPGKKPPKDWPSEGGITFKNMSLAYDEKDVLSQLTFDVQPREKIGIVGRTGAGKSSIISALFRLTEPRGEILMDGVKISEIGLHDLRKGISIIPQDPVLFSGTMRYNLDPFDEYPDDELWKTIRKVELKNAVPALDYKVADAGSNFSVGERQLVCLARAVLRKNRIIVMDEATANVDPETDMLIQKTIRSKFADCSIITVAHRLNSIIDCDRVLVLDKGCLKEYDHPHILLQMPNGIFTGMVNTTGRSSSALLKRIAAETYNGRRSSFQVDTLSILSALEEELNTINNDSNEKKAED
ncbi:Multidrug resistance-associated protein 4 [Orchesella cincta]|uniref:Multidrug resistance-associated protein 4 n=1 Tax=Orchesella cincta TaxID=48709 RepID=A0A1D2MAU4_ORCCI|nr:Multidrug resistance-associated protein 4 [Orchesella cincta]